MAHEYPYLAFAFACERVLQEQDGVLSAIRIVDGLLIRKNEAKPAPDASGVQGITFLIGLKSGNYKGTGKLRLTGHAPSGKALTPEQTGIDIELKGGHHGANLIINAGLPFSEEGVYWFDVCFDDRVLTRMPVSVSVFETPSTTSQPVLSKPVARRSRRKD